MANLNGPFSESLDAYKKFLMSATSVSNPPNAFTNGGENRLEKKKYANEIAIYKIAMSIEDDVQKVTNSVSHDARCKVWIPQDLSISRNS